MTDVDPTVAAPPAGEEIHLPGPSLVPLVNAAGITIALVGLTLSWPFVALGAFIFLWSLMRWIRDTVRDIGELPADHAAH
jgi:hypothetical protein